MPQMPRQAAKVIAFDFNGDGLNDLLFTGSTSYLDYTAQAPSVILINQGNGGFKISNDKAYDQVTSVQYVTDIQVADIDRNSKPDLVITAEWQPISIFLNDGKRLSRFSSKALDDQQGWWQSALITDVDGDGKADLVAGNWGLNNKYNVTPESPLHAYNKDLDNEGKNDFILSYFYKGQYYPFRPKNDLEQELPYLKKEYLSYQKMADKTTMEIFKGKLNEEEHLSAGQFNSIFVSDVLHAATFKPLPYLYQQAPVRSIIKADDKTHDILLNGNFWGVVPYEGKYDALGLLNMHYDKRTRQLSQPVYWVNPSFNFQELNYLSPIVQAAGNAYLAMTYDGRLILINK